MPFDEGPRRKARSAFALTKQHHLPALLTWVLLVVGADFGSTGCIRRGPTTATPVRGPVTESERLAAGLSDDLGQVSGRVAAGQRPETAALAALATARPAPRNDTFEPDVARIRAIIPSWATGFGASLRFVDLETAERTSFVFASDERPAQPPGSSRYQLTARALNDASEVIGHLMVLVDELTAGHFRGDAAHRGLDCGISLGKNPGFIAEAPDTSWSHNAESFCELTLRELPRGMLEGELRARLFDNQAKGFYEIDRGYVVVNR